MSNPKRRKAAKLSPELSARLASGVELTEEQKAKLAEAEAEAETDEQEAETPETPEGEESEESETPEDEDEDEGEGEEDEGEEPEPETSAAPGAGTGLVSYLKSEVSELKAELRKAERDNDKLSSDLSAQVSLAEARQGDIEAMAKVVRLATSRIGVALNAEVAGLDKLSPTDLCATFASLNTKFESRFKVGGKAETTLDDSGLEQSKNKVVKLPVSAAKLTKIS